MTDDEIDARRAMQLAVREIQSLRQTNSILGAKVEVLDIFKAALLGAPRSGGMGEDPIWLLQRSIERIEGKGAA